MNIRTSTFRSEILSSIEDINSITMESYLDSVGSIIHAADKSVMIMENYTGSDVDSFAIFQEADEASSQSDDSGSTVQSGDPETQNSADAKKNKNDNFFMKMIMFPINLLRKLWEFIKQAWNGEIVPVVKSAAQAAQSIPEQTKSLFDKLLGKDESWVKEHAVELGLTGLHLANAIAFVAFINKEKISTIMTEWFSAIKGFFKKIPDNIKETGVVFELTVGDKFKTNVGLRKIVEAIKELPNFFMTIKKLKIYNSTGINANVIDTELTNIIEMGNKIEEVEVMTEIQEYDLADAVTMFTEIGNTIDSMKKDNSVDIKPLTPEQMKSLKGIIDNSKSDNADIGKKLTLFNSIVQKSGVVVSASVNAVKKILEKLTGLFKKEKALSDEIENNPIDTGDTNNDEQNVSDEAEAESMESNKQAPTSQSSPSNDDLNERIAKAKAEYKQAYQKDKTNWQSRKKAVSAALIKKYNLPGNTKIWAESFDAYVGDGEFITESVSHWYSR